jgi:DNA-binding HxlR family transcriptional regulator
MRRQEVSGGARAGGLLGRVRRLGQRGRPGALAGSGRAPEPADARVRRQERALDWRDLQERLDPVLRHRWDLAILVNLDEQEGRRPAQLLAVINAQAGGGWQLSPQVLSVRLRALGQDGYVWHEDVSRIPVTRVYRLLQPGRGLIEDLESFGFLLTTQGSRAGTCAADTA